MYPVFWLGWKYPVASASETCLRVAVLDKEMGPNMWNGVLMKGDDAQPFRNRMPLSNQGSCEYLIRTDPLLSGSLFNHPFLFVVLPRMVTWIYDNQHSSTYIRMSKLGSKRRGACFLWLSKGDAEPFLYGLCCDALWFWFCFILLLSGYDGSTFH
jgi:hypothetical protein